MKMVILFNDIHLIGKLRTTASGPISHQILLHYLSGIQLSIISICLMYRMLFGVRNCRESKKYFCKIW